MSMQIIFAKQRQLILYSPGCRTLLTHADTADIERKTQSPSKCLTAFLMSRPSIRSLPLTSSLTPFLLPCRCSDFQTQLSLLDKSLQNAQHDIWGWVDRKVSKNTVKSSHDKGVNYTGSKQHKNSSSGLAASMSDKHKKELQSLDSIISSLMLDKKVESFLKQRKYTADDIVVKETKPSQKLSSFKHANESENDIIARKVLPIQMYVAPAALYGRHFTHTVVNLHSETQFHDDQVPKVCSLESDILLCQSSSSEVRSMVEPKNNIPQKMEKPNRPSQDQLVQVQEHLVEKLPQFFVSPMDYSRTRPDIVFENNYKGTNKVTRGLSLYAMEMMKVKWVCYWKYVNTKFKILKITAHKEDGTVRVRWRIQGVRQSRAFLSFFKFLPWNFRKTVDEDSDWNDGFSIFHIDNKGLIYKHIVERVIPDDEVVDQKTNSGKLGVKLAILLGLIPKPSIDDLMNLFD